MIRFTVFDCPKEDALGVYPRKTHMTIKDSKSTNNNKHWHFVIDEDNPFEVLSTNLLAPFEDE